MGWGSFLLVGDMGQQVDLGAHAEELGRLRRSLSRRQSKDVDQDEKIAALARENLDLRLRMAALVRVLESQGVVSPDDVPAREPEPFTPRTAKTARSPGLPARAVRREPCGLHRESPPSSHRECATASSRQSSAG